MCNKSVCLMVTCVKRLTEKCYAQAAYCLNIYVCTSMCICGSMCFRCGNSDALHKNKAIHLIQFQKYLNVRVVYIHLEMSQLFVCKSRDLTTHIYICNEKCLLGNN